MKILLQSPDILTLSEAAAVLRISEDSLESLIARGLITALTIDGAVLVPKAYLELFLEKSCQVCYGKEHEQTHLENLTSSFSPFSEGDTEMAKTIRQPVMIHGVQKWITYSTMQEFADKVAQLLESDLTAPPEPNRELHPFDTYAWNWFYTYSEPNVGTATATTYSRQISLHLIPAFQGMAVEEITTDHIQRLFNGMTGTKTTKDKAKMVLNQILDAAVEDGLIPNSPLKSRRLKVTGAASHATRPYTVEQMRYLVAHIGDIKNAADRAYMSLQALHPLRLEEVLGLKGEDIDKAQMQLHICRAVTHPNRNQPEIKGTKTESSHRVIGLSALALPYLPEIDDNDFLFGGSFPLSYTQVRKMCQRIQRDINFPENITPIRFRTTVLTDLYDQTKDIKLAQAAAGHTTSAMTLKYYVKGRESTATATAAVERAYAS